MDDGMQERVFRFGEHEVDRFARLIRAMISRDAAAFRRTAEEVEVLRPGAPFTDQEIFDWFAAYYELILDDEPRGRLDEIGRGGKLFIGLAAGIYQVTLRADGYETWRTEVSVQEKLETVEVSLTPQP